MLDLCMVLGEVVHSADGPCLRFILFLASWSLELSAAHICNSRELSGRMCC